MKKYLFIFFICCSCLIAYAQQANNWSRTELGFSVGSMYYIGDLNQFRPFYESNLAGGLMYRFNYHSRLSFRFNYTLGSLDADDKDSKITNNKNRDLNFHTNIHELSVLSFIIFHFNSVTNAILQLPIFWLNWVYFI